MVLVIPRICESYKNVDFLIGFLYTNSKVGDGPKKHDLEEMIDNNQLENRVKLMGSLKSSQIRDV